jgi:hypothetical protein
MATNQPTEDYSVPEPQDVLAAQTQQYNKEQQSGSGSERALSNIRFGMSQAAGGGPQVQRAQAVKDRFSAIMQGVGSHEDPDEDPLTSQMRLAHALSTGMIDVDPQIAMQANNQLIKLQQAKQQQAYLSAQTGHLQAETKKEDFQQGLNEKLGQVVFAKQGDPDKNGMPTGLVSVGALDPSDPDYAQKVAELQAEAKKQGYQITPMLAKDFVNSKDTLTAMQGQARVQAAQTAATERLQAAVLRSQQAGGTLDGRSLAMVGRTVNGLAEGVASLHNITGLQIGASSGVLGMGAHAGTGIMTAPINALRNTLTDNENQLYNTFASGLAYNLAAVESAGLVPRGSLSAGMERIIFQPGDSKDGITTLAKLAEAKQIFEKGMEFNLSNPKVPDMVKEEIQTKLGDLRQVIPFNMDDVIALRNEGRGSKATIQDMIHRRLGSKADSAGGSDEPSIGDANGIPDGKTANGGTAVARNGKWYQVKK